jgi:transcriptional regulator with XRE-family HTH domain
VSLLNPLPTSRGGARLREARLRRRRTQLWVELEADLGSGYLQRVESGRVAQPDRLTVERVLDALEASYEERREVLALFGYTSGAPLPSAADLARAAESARPQLEAFPFPAYVLDCAHRVVAWNPPAARLMPLERLAGQSLLAAWFDPSSPLADLLVEPDAFLPALIWALRYEMQAFRHEAWSAEVLRSLLQLERFRMY